MVAVIYAHPYESRERLDRLGTSRDEWIEVVKACVAGRGDATDNHPQSAGGQFAWIFGTGRMREIFRRKGLDKEVLNGVETVVDHQRKVRFAVVSTDGGTAYLDRSPKNRTPKGAASEKITDLNNQQEMDFVDSSGNPISQQDESDGYSSWYLCVYDDGNDVRAELSSPIGFKSGYFIKFSERIFILGPGEWSAVSTSNSDDDLGPELEIDVRRK